MLLIGTLYNGEGGMSECQQAIDAQGVEFARVVISDVLRKEAHRQLFSFFKNNPVYTHMIKVDADMVLHPGAFQFLLDRVSEYPNMGRLGACLHDHLSGLRIHGVHIFSQYADWDFDIMIRHMHPGRCLKAGVPTRSWPDVIGDHCKHATPRQAFFAGWARAARNIAGQAPEDVWSNRVLQRAKAHRLDPVLQACAAGINAVRSGKYPMTTENGYVIDAMFEAYINEER